MWPRLAWKTNPVRVTLYLIKLLWYKKFKDTQWRNGTRNCLLVSEQQPQLNYFFLNVYTCFFWMVYLVFFLYQCRFISFRAALLIFSVILFCPHVCVPLHARCPTHSVHALTLNYHLTILPPFHVTHLPLYPLIFLPYGPFSSLPTYYLTSSYSYPMAPFTYYPLTTLHSHILTLWPLLHITHLSLYPLIFLPYGPFPTIILSHLNFLHWSQFFYCRQYHVFSHTQHHWYLYKCYVNDNINVSYIHKKIPRHLT